MIDETEYQMLPWQAIQDQNSCNITSASQLLWLSSHSYHSTTPDSWSLQYLDNGHKKIALHLSYLKIGNEGKADGGMQKILHL